MLTGDTKIQSDRSQATRGNLTLTWSHTSPLWNFSLIGQRNIILFRSNSSHLCVWLEISGLVFVHICPFSNKNSLVTLVFLSLKFQPFFEFWKGQTYKNSFVRLFWSTLQFFLRRKTSQSSPLDLKLDEMAKQGLDWKDNKILTNTKHDQGRTETVHIIKYKTHLVRI